MVKRFTSHAEASLYAADRRAEGFLAEVCDEHSGHLWGAATTGGFRVLVSDAPVDPEGKEEGPAGPGHWLFRAVVAAVLLVVAVGLVPLAFAAAGVALRTAQAIGAFALGDPRGLAGHLLLAVALAWILCGILSLASTGPGWLRDPRERHHSTARQVVMVIGLLLVAVLLLV